MAFDTLPWKEIVNANDEVTILLPMQVLRELEKKKDDSNDKAVNKRAREICAKLGEILLDNKESSIPVITCEMPPKSEFKPGFLLEVSDDVILMSAIHFQSQNQVDLVLVSWDTPMLLKAKQSNLSYVKMPDKYLLPSKQVDKEKQQLREELRRWTSRLPASEVVFKDNSKVLHVKRYIPKEIIVDDKLTEEERDFYLLQEEAKASRERFYEVELFVHNGGTASTGAFTVHLDLSKLKTCRISIESASMVVPEMFRTEEEKNKKWDELEEWEIKEPVRYFSIFYRDDNKEICKEFNGEYDEITQGLTLPICYVEIDLLEAENGSIDWTIYDPMIPDPVKGTIHVVVA